MTVRLKMVTFALCMMPSWALAQGLRTLGVEEYQQRLEGMWLGAVIANWTGLITEGKFQEPPFLTDADWGVTAVQGQVIDFVLDQDPWWADDDTDIEYVYVHLLGEHGVTELSGGQIRDGWIEHVNRYIWVSNERARELMERGVKPPATSIGAANAKSVRIDAQLTTEVFGALAPGCPMAALEMADVAIRATASSHAAHAAQYFVVLYSLTTQTPDGLTDAERVRWLVEEASFYLPATSKARDVVRFVLESYDTNPDKSDWESTRDAIYERYHLQAKANGFKYRGWTESSVNLATGVMALLYGELDYRRTVQIGTLSGWDSDNPTATMGGLLGLMLGKDGIRAQFPGVNLSERFWILRTRDNLPDYLPNDPEAEDTFALMSARMKPIVTQAIQQAGGFLDSQHGVWVLPPTTVSPDRTPTTRLHERSANVRVNEAGGTVNVSASVASSPWQPYATYGSPQVHLAANGFEHDFSGREPNDPSRYFYSMQGAGLWAGDQAWVSAAYPEPVEAHTIRLIEGDSFDEPGAVGGWFESVSVEIQSEGVWYPLAVAPSEPLDPATPFQIIDFVLPVPLMVTGVRISGPVGGLPGGEGFATIAEIDVLSSPVELMPRGFDRNVDGRVNLEDLYTYLRSPVDLTGDGRYGPEDLALMMRAVALAVGSPTDAR